MNTERCSTWVSVSAEDATELDVQEIGTMAKLFQATFEVATMLAFLHCSFLENEASLVRKHDVPKALSMAIDMVDESLLRVQDSLASVEAMPSRSSVWHLSFSDIQTWVAHTPYAVKDMDTKVCVSFSFDLESLASQLDALTVSYDGYVSDTVFNQPQAKRHLLEWLVHKAR